jgi:hypothetical protein
MSSADDQYETKTTAQQTASLLATLKILRPSGRPKQAPVPLQSDGADFEDPVDPATADSDEQLGMSRRLGNMMGMVLTLA